MANMVMKSAPTAMPPTKPARMEARSEAPSARS